MSHRRSIIAATATLITGAVASLAGNLQAINLDNANPGLGEHASAILWPALLLLTVETLIHTPWLATWRDNLTKLAITALVFAVAAWVSYWHLANVLSHYGYDVASRYAGPLSIDAAMVLATIALNRVGQARRDEMSKNVVTAEGVDKWHAEELAKGDVLAEPAQPVEMLDNVMQGVMSRIDESIAERNEEADMWARLEQEFAGSDAPVSPAPIVRPEVPAMRTMQEALGGPRGGKARLSAQDSAEAHTLAVEGRRHGLSAGDISEILAGYYGVSARTIRRQSWWVPTMAGKLDSQAG
jgi:hypothetical protein